jgi:hypothetical protein
MKEILLLALFPLIAGSVRENAHLVSNSSSVPPVLTSLRGRRNLESSSHPSNYPFAYEWNTSLSSFQPRYYDLPADSPSLQKGFSIAPPTIPFKWCGQAKQDLTVLEIFHDKEKGYFVDLAANEWIIASNTFVLEYFNHWKGVCIEPLTQYIIPLLAHRKCKVFVNPVSEKANEIVKFRMHKGESGILGSESTDGKTDEITEMDNKGAFNPRTDIDLMTTTLTSVLDFAKAPTIIDYLSLDIEGAEYFAMKGFDFSRYTILLMSVERPKPRLHYLLIQHGYMFLFQNSDWGDCFYIHHTIPEFVQIMNSRYGLANTGYAKWFDEIKEYISYPSWNHIAYVPFEEILKTQPFPSHLFKGVIHNEKGGNEEKPESGISHNHKPQGQHPHQQHDNHVVAR